MNKKNCIIWGYWVKNVGDDLFLLALKTVLDNKFNLIIATEKKYYDYYTSLGFKIENTDSLSYKILYKIANKFQVAEPFFRRINKNTYFVAIGGSLFSENKTQHLELMQLVNLEFAVKNAEKSFIVGSNFGPYKTAEYYNAYKALFSKFDNICFRDKYSYHLFENELDNVRWSFDIALQTKWEDYCENVEKFDIAISAIDLSNRKELKNRKKDYEEKLIGICKRHIDAKQKVALLVFCEKEGDNDVYIRIKKRLSSDLLQVIDYTSITRILSIIRSCDLLYATRFHAIMMGLYFSKKMIPIVYNEKSTNALLAYTKNFDSYDINEVERWDIDEMINSGRILELNVCCTKQFDALIDSNGGELKC